MVEQNALPSHSERKPAPDHTTETYIIGISGISSSGKTTLACYLRDIFRDISVTSSASAGVTFTVSLVHQDDFFFPESTLPVRQVTVKTREDEGGVPVETEQVLGLVDWDFPGAVDFVKLKSALKLLRTGTPYSEALAELEIKDLPAHLQTGKASVAEAVLAKVKSQILSRVRGKPGTDAEVTGNFRVMQNINLILIDGFILYHAEEDVESPDHPKLISLFDLRLFLRVPYAVAKQRREARKGYVTTDGYWEDPKGYFDGIVWPNYVRYHRHLFVHGDVEAKEGLVKEWGPEGAGVELQPEGEDGMEGLVMWASSRIMDLLARE